MGWTTPWVSLRIAECYRDVIGIAPLSKLMIGSGCHGTPEIAWLAADAVFTVAVIFLLELRKPLLRPRERAHPASAVRTRSQ
jgi:hypothetical protein